jgi:hypothetical protein
MDIFTALREEEAKWEKQAEEARQQLETVRAATKLFRGGETIGNGPALSVAVVKRLTGRNG